MSQPRKPAPSPERTLGRFDGALLVGLLICSALVTVFLLVGRAYWLAPQTATPLASLPPQTETITPLPTAIIAVAGSPAPTATPLVSTPEIVPTPRVEPLDLAGLFAGQRFAVRGQGVPGQTIALYDNDLLVGTRVVDATGAWEIIITQGLPAGEHRLVAVAIGLDGGRSEVAPVGFTMIQAGLSGIVTESGLTATVPATEAPSTEVAVTEVQPTQPPTITPTLPPSSTPSLPPTKLPTPAVTAAALAVTESAASPTGVPTERESSPTPVPVTREASATPKPVTQAASPTPETSPARSTMITPTLVPATAATATSPATEVIPSPSPTVALTALGFLPTGQPGVAQPTEARPTALPTATSPQPTATSSATPAATATSSPTRANPSPTPTTAGLLDGQGGEEGLLPQPGPIASAAQPASAESGLSGWGAPGGSVTLLAEDGQILATAPIDADGRWTASPDPASLADAGQITVQEVDPAGIIVARTPLQPAAELPLLPRTGASTVGRTARANGPALALLLGMALLLGGVLFHQAGRLLRWQEADSGPASPAPRGNQKGTPARRP